MVADGQTIGGEGLFSAKTNTDRVEDASNPAFSFGISENQFIASFDLARQNSNVKILSCPMIVTTHGQDAEISIEEQHPYITSAITDTANPTATRSTIDYMDVGINLKVKPFVGTDQVVRIEITQKVNSISRYTIIDSNPSPVVSQRMAKSIISVKNNEVIVLGGLQQTDIAETDGGVWLLSDIPLIGQLFRPSKATEKRRDLIMFVRPRIIMSQNVADTISDAMMEDSTVKREIENFLSRGRFYSDKEMEANKEEFESNRLYNKILEDPAAFIMQEKIVKEGSTKDIEAKRAKEKEDKEKAKIEAEKSAQNSEKSAPENPAENKD